LGVYILQFQQFAFKGLTPAHVTVLGSKNDDDVDLIASAIIAYPGNKYAQVMCDATVELPNEGQFIWQHCHQRVVKFVFRCHSWYRRYYKNTHILRSVELYN